MKKIERTTIKLEPIKKKLEINFEANFCYSKLQERLKRFQEISEEQINKHILEFALIPKKEPEEFLASTFMGGYFKNSVTGFNNWGKYTVINYEYFIFMTMIKMNS